MIELEKAIKELLEYEPNSYPGAQKAMNKVQKEFFKLKNNEGPEEYKAKLVQPSSEEIIGMPSDSEVLDPWQTEAENMLERLGKIQFRPLSKTPNSIAYEEIYKLIFKELIRLEKKTNINN